jgi:hypothetical protein
MQKSYLNFQLGKELNAAIKGLEQNVDKDWREIETVESRKKLKTKSMRLIHELFFARII